MTLTTRRAQACGKDHSSGVRTTHGFSFGAHPGPTSLGGLVLHDLHQLDPGHGFDEHDHRELEIVTWVLAGRLEHRGLASASLGAGSVQHLRAGTGVRHAEHAGELPTEVVQCWLLPSESGRAPAYASRDCSTVRGLAPVLTLAEGTLHVARLLPGEHFEVPRAAYAHVFVARGRLDRLGAGEAMHLTGEAGMRLTARTPAEVLVWVLPDLSWRPDETDLP